MATVGTIGISATIAGGQTGQRTFSVSIPIVNGLDVTASYSLTSGANTITPPTGGTTMVFFGPNSSYPQPNPLSTVTLTVKGVSGDTGLSIHGGYPTVWTPGTWPTTFVINASGSTTVEIFYA